VVPDGGSPLASLAAHLRALQRDGGRVLLLTADRPYRHLREALAGAGVDVGGLLFVDAVSLMDGAAPTERPPNVWFLQSPTMLEMMAMRVEQVAARNRPVHVVVDSLNALAIYNGLEPVQEFSLFLANRLRAGGTSADFVLHDNQRGKALQDLIHGFVDERVQLGGLKP